MAAIVDFEKAFNRQNHHKFVTKISDTGVLGKQFKMVIGFLEDRTMIVVFKGEMSGVKEVPGGGPHFGERKKS